MPNREPLDNQPAPKQNSQPTHLVREDVPRPLELNRAPRNQTVNDLRNQLAQSEQKNAKLSDRLAQSEQKQKRLEQFVRAEHNKYRIIVLKGAACVVFLLIGVLLVVPIFSEAMRQVVTDPVYVKLLLHVIVLLGLLIAPVVWHYFAAPSLVNAIRAVVWRKK